MKHIVILTALVKYPSSDTTYLSSNSYAIEQVEAKPLSDIIDKFKEEIETDGFKILNMLAYVVPNEQVEEIIASSGYLCDGGANG